MFVNVFNNKLNKLAINNDNKEDKNVNIKSRKRIRHKNFIVNKKNNICLYYKDKSFRIILIINNTNYTN